MTYLSSRRDLLKLMALHLAALPLAGSLGCRAPLPRGWEPLARRAAAWFDREDLEAARLIGARFLRRVGHNNDALQAELGATIKLLEGVAPAHDRWTYEAVIAADFQALRVRDVEGWTLAATEAHLAALVELFGIRA